MNTTSPPDFYAGKPFQHGRYSCGQGYADRITLPNGKILFTGQSSFQSVGARSEGYTVDLVRYQGNCFYGNIEDRASNGAPVWINGEYITDKPDLFATDEDLSKFNLKL
jgi:hypothetical protein